MIFSGKQIWRKKDGVAIIEFAIIAPLFLFLLSAGLEFGIVNFISGTLNTVVSEAGRLGMTGGNYTDMQDPSHPPLSREEFLVDYIHNKFGPLMNMGELTIKPVPYDSLSGMTIGGGTSEGYGSAGQVVIYEVEFKWKVLTPFMGNVLGDDEGDYVIRARTVIQNEVFS